MKAVSDLMTTEVAWIRPSTRVQVAVTMMKNQKLGALPVLYSDETVVGLVTEHDLLGESPDTPVMDVMRRDFVAVDPQTTANIAAELMSEAKADYLLVMRDNTLVGIISHADLLPELGKTFDPLTLLPWADSFREWAISALKRGAEISVIFFDLDDFGLFNKKHSHVVGDTVLTQVAQVLRGGTDSEQDIVCRYGGDEFAIASIRQVDDAMALAESLKRDISMIEIDELPDGVSGTYGMSGGRRTREREDVHYAATINDLITRASRNCTANKPRRAEEAAPPAPAPAPISEAQPVAAPSVPEAQPLVAAPAASHTVNPPADASEQEPDRPSRLKIQTISMSTTDTEVTVGVVLRRDGRDYKREVTGFALGGKNVLRLVAEATAGAACKAVAPEHGVVVEEILVHGTGSEEEVVTVIANFVSPRWTIHHAGSALVKRGDQHRAAAAALLASVNRLLENAPQAEEEVPVGQEHRL